jgi:hypothetical protein
MVKATNKTEAAELKRMGAKAHKNSGRNMVKADGNNADFVIDVKEAGRSFTINQDVWAKICTDAMKVDKNKSPLLQLVIGEGSQKIRLSVIEWSILEDLIERASDDNA